MSNPYSRSVFINCPFDRKYEKLFQSIIFVIHDAGLFARCARELSDSSENRIDKIIKIISECKYGIHDISRVQLDLKSKLPRYNMPFELGLFIGCKRFGHAQNKNKSCIILDKKQYRYQKFLSDMSGCDILSHNDSSKGVIRSIRNWLQTETKYKTIPDTNFIYRRYNKFQKDLPEVRRRLFRLYSKNSEITFIDFQNCVIEWLNRNRY